CTARTPASLGAWTVATHPAFRSDTCALAHIARLSVQPSLCSLWFCHTSSNGTSLARCTGFTSHHETTLLCLLSGLAGASHPRRQLLANAAIAPLAPLRSRACKAASNQPARGAAMTSGPQFTNSLLRRA